MSGTVNSSDETIAIRARGLSKCYHIYGSRQDRLKQFFARGKKQYYREFWANRGIDLAVPRGKTYGIVGRNGAGKTTLLQMVAGILQPTEGELEVHGRVTSLLELGSGFNGDFTGRENVFLNGAVLGISRSEMEERFDAIESFAGIGDFIDQPVKTYSAGMFVRLAFSVLANLDPDIFIVDEALSVGDAYFSHRCMHRFHELRERGTTILFVSHDAGSMKRLCDHVIWLEQGSVRAAGDPQPVVDRYLTWLFELEEHAAAEPDLAEVEPSGDEAEAVKRTLRYDRRLGDQKLTIESVQLQDEEGRPAVSIDHGKEVTLHLGIRDQGRPDGSGWSVGYILRNRLGEDLASTSSQLHGVELGELGRGAETCVKIRIRLPLLAAGSYALTPTVAYHPPAGEIVLGDQLDNAAIFDVTAKIDVYCLLSLETAFERG